MEEFIQLQLNIEYLESCASQLANLNDVLQDDKGGLQNDKEYLEHEILRLGCKFDDLKENFYDQEDDYEDLKQDRNELRIALDDGKNISYEKSCEIRRVQESFNLLRSKFVEAKYPSGNHPPATIVKFSMPQQTSVIRDNSIDSFGSSSALQVRLSKLQRLLELQEPLFKVGVAIRLRFWEHAKRCTNSPQHLTITSSKKIILQLTMPILAPMRVCSLLVLYQRQGKLSFQHMSLKISSMTIWPACLRLFMGLALKNV
jgi:hypothetical protein